MVTSLLGCVVELTIISAYVSTTKATSGRRGFARWVGSHLGFIAANHVSFSHDCDLTQNTCQVSFDVNKLLKVVYIDLFSTEYCPLNLGVSFCLRRLALIDYIYGLFN